MGKYDCQCADCLTTLLKEPCSYQELKRHRDLMLDALKVVYRKHHRNDDSIGWEEMDTKVFDTLCEVMGDDGYQEWISRIDKESHE